MNTVLAGGTTPHRAATTALLFLVWLLGVTIASHHNPFAGLDVAVGEWFVEHRSPGMTAIVSALTVIFSPVWVGMWTVISAAVLGVRDRSLPRATQVLMTVAMAGAMCEILKIAVGRARPPIAHQIGGTELSMSFPSGHVSGTAALTLGLAVALTARSSLARRAAAICVALAVSLVAAATRLYLGAHWLTDVTAAIALGVGVAAIAPAVTATTLTRLSPHLPERFHAFIDPTRSRDDHDHDHENSRCTATH